MVHGLEAEGQCLLAKGPPEGELSKEPLALNRVVRRTVAFAMVFLIAIAAIAFMTRQGQHNPHQAAEAAIAFMTRQGQHNPHQAAEAAPKSMVQRSALSNIVSAGLGSVGKAGTLLVKSAQEAAHGQWSSARRDAFAGIGSAGQSCVEMVGGLAPEAASVIVGCGALALGSDIANAVTEPSEADDLTGHLRKIIDSSLSPLQDAVGNLNEEYEKILQRLEDIGKLIHCEAVSSASQKLRIIMHQYEDSMAAVEVTDEVAANFAVWSAYVDDAALQAFCRDVQKCDASIPEHVTTLVAARTQLFALKTLYYKIQNKTEMLQNVRQSTDADMELYLQTQREMCLYNQAVAVDSSQVPSKCWEDVLCVVNSALPRDLSEFDAKDCPEEKWSSMGGPLAELPRSLRSANFRSITNIEGDLKDLPRGLESANFTTATEITGELKNLPRSLTWANFYSATAITGDLKDLPTTLTYLDFNSAIAITGDLKNLPRTLTSVDFHFATAITGDLKDLPRGLTAAYFGFETAITGDLKDLPRGLTKAYFGFETEAITGDLKDLPRGLTEATFESGTAITGDLKDLPTTLTCVGFHLAIAITGDLKNLPRGLTCVDFGKARAITGDLKDLPRGLMVADFYSATAITGDPSKLPTGMDVQLHDVSFF